MEQQRTTTIIHGCFIQIRTELISRVHSANRCSKAAEPNTTGLPAPSAILLESARGCLMVC